MSGIASGLSLPGTLVRRPAVRKPPDLRLVFKEIVLQDRSRVVPMLQYSNRVNEPDDPIS